MADFADLADALALPDPDDRIEAVLVVIGRAESKLRAHLLGLEGMAVHAEMNDEALVCLLALKQQAEEQVTWLGCYRLALAEKRAERPAVLH